MAKAKPAPAAAKAEIDEKPFILMEGAGKKHLTTLDVKMGEVEDLKPSPPVRGPQTGGSQLSNVDYLRLHASNEELGVFRAAVMARMKRTGEVGWRTLPNGMKIPGNLVLAGCEKCGRWEWIKPEHAGLKCWSCNSVGRAGSGHLRLASAEEEKAWFARETAAWEKLKADAPKRKAEVDAFNRRRMEDGR